MNTRPPSQFSKAEARSLLLEYEAAVPQRAAAFVEAVRMAGGPADDLDYSHASLVPAWVWLVANVPVPEVPVSEDTMLANDPPWWYFEHPEWAQELGPLFCRRLTEIAAYAVAVALRERPGARLGSGAIRSTYDNWPVVLTDGGLPWAVDSLAIVLARRVVIKGQEPDPRTLQQSYEGFTAFRGPIGVAKATPPYVLEEVDGWRGITHTITIDDAVAHEAEQRVKRFVKRLEAFAAIREVIHQDREVILLNAPTSVGLTDAVAAAWVNSR